MKNYKKIVMFVVCIATYNDLSGQSKNCYGEDAFFSTLNMSIDSLVSSENDDVSVNVERMIDYHIVSPISKVNNSTDNKKYKDCIVKNIYMWLNVSSTLVKFPDYSINLLELGSKSNSMLRKIDCLESLIHLNNRNRTYPALVEVTDTSCFKLYKIALEEIQKLDYLSSRESRYRNMFQSSVLELMLLVKGQKELNNMPKYMTNEDILLFMKTTEHVKLFKQALYTFLIPNIDSATLEDLKDYYGFDKTIPRVFLEN